MTLIRLRNLELDPVVSAVARLRATLREAVRVVDRLDSEVTAVVRAQQLDRIAAAPSGAEIRARRQALGLSLAEFAEMVPVSDRRLGEIERGDHAGPESRASVGEVLDRLEAEHG